MEMSENQLTVSQCGLKTLGQGVKMTNKNWIKKLPASTFGRFNLFPGFDEPIDDLTEFYRLMHEKRLTVTGLSRDQLRRSQINTTDVLAMASSMNELLKLKHLKALQRTLKV